MSTHGRPSREELDKKIADILARKPSQADLAETYLTRVDELELLNAEQAEKINVLTQELISTTDQLDACTAANLQFQRQIADLTQQVEQEVRLRQQDFDRGQGTP